MPFADNHGVRLHWRMDGEPGRPALLLLNSIGVDMSLWERAGPHLVAHFRLLRMDARGHGASDAPPGDYTLDALASDAAAVLDAAGVGRATVCGLSLGGMIAMTLALQAPDRIDALICACTSPQMDAEAWRARVDTVRTTGMDAIADAAMGRFFSEAFALRHPEVVAGVRAGLLAMNPEGYAGCGAAIRDMALTGRLGAIALPCLVISGTKDISTPFEGHGERILSAVAGARSVSLDAAHLACLEAPAAFAAAVGDFLTGVAAGR